MQNTYKKLSHFDLKESYQFITFRTQDSIDDFLIKIQEEKIDTSKKEYKIDTYLDNSKKGAYLNDEILKFLYDYLIQSQDKFYELIIFCIMPNHIHLLIKQIESLPKIISKIKGSSSIQINKMLGKKGKFWERNYFDKAIKNEKHFETTYNYIKNNPLKANLSDYKDRIYSIYEDFSV